MSAGAPAPFGWDVPDNARIVALIHARSEAERSATAVDAIATSTARRRGRTLVVNCERGSSPLDELAGAPEASDSGGMAAFLGGQARLTQVVVQRADRPYAYLPAGSDTEAAAGLLDHPALERFVSRAKERGGTLFLVMSEQTQPASGLLRLLDGYIALGTVLLEDDGGMECYGRVSFESSWEPESATEPEPDSELEPVLEPEPESASAPEPVPEPEADPEPAAPDAQLVAPAAEPAAPPPGRPEPGRAGGRRTGARLVGPTLVIAASALGGWLVYTQGWLDDAISRIESLIAAREDAPAISAAAEEESPGAEEADALAEPPEVVAQPPVAMVPDEAAAAVAFEATAERPYSVLIASFGDAADAAARVTELREVFGGMLYFTAPTMIREVRYHRILAGAVATESEASSLMDELVAGGAAEEANAWLLRPVRFSYDLGVYADRAEMETRLADLGSRGVPAYSLETALDGMPVYRVYGGAYESEEAAAPMAEILEAAGEAATLIVRRGGAIPPTP